METKHRPTVMIDGREYPDVRVGDVWVLVTGRKAKVLSPALSSKLAGWEVATHNDQIGVMSTPNPNDLIHIVTRDGKPYEPPAPPKPTLPVEGQRCVIDGLQFEPISTDRVDDRIVRTDDGGAMLMHTAVSMRDFAGYYYPNVGGECPVICSEPAGPAGRSKMLCGISRRNIVFPTHVVFRMEATNER